MSNNVVIFGGSGGLAQKTIPFLKTNSIDILSSKDCDVRNIESIRQKIKNKNIALYFSVVNYDNLISNLQQKDVDHSLDVNVKGYINLLNCISNEWKDSGGSVIYISSILSSTPIKGTSLYSSCKSFCDTFTKVFALENAKYNITCNSIQLGYFDGGLTYKVPEKILESVKQNIPCKRFGEGSELAELINSIVNNRYMTGSIVKLSGGLL